MDKFSELGALRHLPPATKEVQEKISVLQKFITDNYYVCTNEILNGLGQMLMNASRRILTGRAGTALLNLFVRLFLCIVLNFRFNLKNFEAEMP